MDANLSKDNANKQGGSGQIARERPASVARSARCRETPDICPRTQCVETQLETSPRFQGRSASFGCRQRGCQAACRIDAGLALKAAGGGRAGRAALVHSGMASTCHPGGTSTAPLRPGRAGDVCAAAGSHVTVTRMKSREKSVDGRALFLMLLKS